MPGIGAAPLGPMEMKDVCDLQPRAAHGRWLASGSRSLLDPRREAVERAGYAADRGVGDTRVKRGGVELGVPEQNLNDPDVGVLFQEMRGEAVPQRMRRYPLLDSGGFGGGVDSAIELSGRQRLDRIAAGKQPTSWQQDAAPPPFPPPGAQHFEQLWRQHGVSIFATLAALDPQQHAFGIDIADPERDHLRDAQTGAVCSGKRGLVLRPGRRLQQ